MPKRLIDDSLLDSPSLEVVSPRAQDAFPRFILLCDDFGCFEVNVAKLKGMGWSKRPDVSEENLAGWIDEYATRRAPGEPPLAMLWTERARRWCFLTGWFGPHGQRRRTEYDPATVAGQKGSKRRTPAPPADLLAAVMSGEVRLQDGLPPGSPREDDVSRGGPAEFPPGNAAGGESGKLNDSVPGREMRGNAAAPRISREFPAHAVPDAVPDAVPVPAAAAAAREARAAAAAENLPAGTEGGTIPTQAQYLADRYPRLAELVERLDAEGLGLALPKAKPGQSAQAVKGALDQLVAKHGVEALVRHVRHEQARRASAGATPIGSLTVFSTLWAAPGFQPPSARAATPVSSGCPEWDQVLDGMRQRFAAEGRGDPAGTVLRLFGRLTPERSNDSIRLTWTGERNGLAEEYLPDLDRLARNVAGLGIQLAEGT